MSMNYDEITAHISGMIENVQSSITFLDQEQTSRLNHLKVLLESASPSDVAYGRLDTTINEIRNGEKKLFAMQQQISTLERFAEWYKEQEETTDE